MDGGLAEYLVVEAKNAKRVPQELSLEIAGMYRCCQTNFYVTETAGVALVEPLAVGWHAVRMNLPDQCHSALVVGAGPIGLAIVQALKVRGVKDIIVADTNPAKQKYAFTAGAHHFINSLEEDVIEFCTRTAHASAGVQIAFDTAGKQTTLDQCVGSVCIGGTIVNVAIWGGSASFLPNVFALGEKGYVGSAVYIDRDFDEVIASITSGKAIRSCQSNAMAQLTPHCRHYQSGLYDNV